MFNCQLKLYLFTREVARSRQDMDMLHKKNNSQEKQPSSYSSSGVCAFFLSSRMIIA